MRMPDAILALPVPARYGVIGGICLGALGCVVGLVIGLNVYAPTAWAATFEVGIPAALLGAVMGLAVGVVVALVRKRRRAQTQ
ncbi:MAG: hypothetical protein WBX27_12515 [Specibacter sp.]